MAISQTIYSDADGFEIIIRYDGPHTEYQVKQHGLLRAITHTLTPARTEVARLRSAIHGATGQSTASLAASTPEHYGQW